MDNLLPCNICGKTPILQKSHSSRKISHKCKDFNSGWSNKSSVIKKWNEENDNTKKQTFWRLLNDDEIIQKGDRYYDYITHKWTTIPDNFSLENQDNYNLFRPFFSRKVLL